MEISIHYDEPHYVTPRAHFLHRIKHDLPTSSNTEISLQLCEKEGFFSNTSIAAPGPLAHRLQRRTACNTSPLTLSKLADGIQE